MPRNVNPNPHQPSPRRPHAPAPGPKQPVPGRPSPRPRGSDGCRWAPSYNYPDQKPPIPCARRQQAIIMSYDPRSAAQGASAPPRVAPGVPRGGGAGEVAAGPAAMLAVARHLGRGAGVPEAELLALLARSGGTDANGTPVAGIARMAEALGLKAQTRGPGPDLAWIERQLLSIKAVVVNGDRHELGANRNPKATSGHYVVVYGKEGGDFLVHDPANPSLRKVSREDLERYIRSCPNGGYQIAVGGR